MAAVPQPFSFEGVLQLAADSSLPASPIPFGTSGQFTSKEDVLLNLVGSGSKTVDFGTIIGPGAKGLLVEYPSQIGAAPIMCTFNGGNQALEVSPGGHISFGSPNPSAGLLSLVIVFTASCQVSVRILG